MAAAEPFMEKVTGGELLLGGRASAHLRNFVATLCQGYAASQPDLAINPAAYHAGQPLPPKWQALVERGHVQMGSDRTLIDT